MNTRPLAVEIGPPSFTAVPVPTMPFAVRSAYSPSGVRQTMSPVVVLTATSSDHGGALHGYPCSSTKKLVGTFCFPNDGRTPDDRLGCNCAMTPTCRVLTKTRPSDGLPA